MRVPREIDELMWAVAEDGRESTIDQFNERYPQYGGELEKRRQMVDGIRGSRPHAESARFVPRDTVRSFGPSRLAVAGVAALVLASVTFATYAAVKIVNDRRSAGPEIKPPEIVFNPPTFSTEPPPMVDPKTTGPLAANDVQPIKEDAGTQDVYMGLITIRSEDTTLEKAINDIVLQAGLDVTIAPGFKDKRIRISFVDQPLFSVLQELGKHFGFTPFKQGTTEILIVPAVDKGAGGLVEMPGAVGTVGEGSETGEGASPGKVNNKRPDETGHFNQVGTIPTLTWPAGG